MKYFLLFIIASGFAFAQTMGDLRNNPATKALEIYVDIEIVNWDAIDSLDVSYIRKWCNVDSLYKEHGDRFNYNWGSLDLGYIIWHRRLFNMLSEERR